ncbi:hypothetical protein SAMN05216582_1245 [Selenomonas ruminantium]|uniref:DUF2939 domain-containing protein n=1 Tax=Selenomonas ruminantium TaxID=971 RepID=A0A1M6WD25_SELRU|nr:hypothetical protein [Selenomonas ruminantium]SHK91591.1 hypothetical protein SAMN05216582_1245 [Selenomonas ruminantium]
MDDYTWQKRLRARRSREHRRLYFGFFLLAAIIGATVWYFFFYIRTPEYALQQIQTAITEHDEETFKHYVNAELLSSRAYDDLTIDLFAYDSELTPKTRSMFEKFYILIKPQLAEGMENAALQRISTGSWSLPEGTDILKGRQLGIDFERFIERSQIRNTTITGIGKVEHSGHSATAELTIREDYTQTEFTLQLAMEQAEDGHWQVAYIKNYKAYLDQISPLQNKDIADYIAATKKIVNDSNETFEVYQNHFKRLNSSKNGHLSSQQKQNIASLIEGDIIPSLQERQTQLDTVEVPPGAQYLARQRQQATETSIKAWQHYVKGLREDNPAEFATAETLHKQELAIDLRVQDIIRHTAISKNIPNLP